jgi:hypothetical protein
MLNAPAPAKLETAEDYLALGEYWHGIALNSGEGWGSCCSAYERAAQKFDERGEAEDAANARVAARSAASYFEAAYKKQRLAR